MVVRFEDTDPWEFNRYIEATGLRVLPVDLREHLIAIERMPEAAMSAWTAEQVLSQQAGRSHYVSDAARRKIERTLRLGAATEVGQLLAKSHARHSATLAYWLSQAVVFVAE